MWTDILTFFNNDIGGFGGVCLIILSIGFLVFLYHFTKLNQDDPISFEDIMKIKESPQSIKGVVYLEPQKAAISASIRTFKRTPNLTRKRKVSTQQGRFKLTRSKSSQIVELESYSFTSVVDRPISIAPQEV